MRSRIEDVAEAAGVSIKTVSRVLNNEPNVRRETQARVQAAVEQLGYRPNPSARSLASQRSYVLALAYNNPSRNYLMEIQSGMLAACHASQYNLLLAPLGTGRQALPDLSALFETSRPDGVVLIPPLTDDPVVIACLEGKRVPFACIAPRDPTDRIGVRMDETTAVVEMMQHLLALGHHRIGHIKGPQAHGACQWRHAGYRQALRAAGIAYDPALVVSGRFSFESGLEGAQRLLSLDDPPTAIFAANDDMAAAVFRVAGERGLRVPRDLSVCGFDDTPIARHIYPALTTVRQPSAEMGRLASQQLIERIRAPHGGHMITLEHTVLVRESSAPPRRRQR